MNQDYQIKGIEKIIKKVGEKQLAEYYQVGEEENLENLIIKSLKDSKVPNGLEIAAYETMSYEDIRKLGGMEKYIDNLFEKNKKGKALVGINFNITGQDITDLYFYIDKPIKKEELEQMNADKFIGVVNIHGYAMRK